MKKTGFNDYVYHFNVDYDAFAIDEILDIYNYLMKKVTKCKKVFWFFKRYFFYSIINFIDFNEPKFDELYFNEQSIM